MTTTMAMPYPVDAPLPVAPPHSLLNITYFAQDEDGDDTTRNVLVRTTDDRWANGIQIYGFPATLPSNWEPCSAGTFREKDEGEEWDNPLFGAFVSYLPITCSTMSFNRDPDGFARRAERALDARLSFAVEEALSQGIDQSSNPFFSDGNVDILAGGAAQPAQTGLSYLENAIGETGQLGFIHATPAVAAAWGFGAGLTTPAMQRERGVHSPSGNPVAIGGGYIGAQPSGGAAAVAGQSWAFATGPVEVRVGEVAIYQVSEVVDREINLGTYRAERFVVASWDTALQAAVLIDWSP